MADEEPKKMEFDVGDNKAKERNQLLIGSYSTVGMLLLVYFGIAPLLIPPFAVAVICGLVAWKLVKPTTRPMVPAIAMLSGDIVLPLAGVVLAGMPNSPIVVMVLIQAVLVSGGVLWLIFRPGAAPVVFLTVVQALLILDNGLTVASSYFVEGGTTQFYSKTGIHSLPQDTLMYKGLVVSASLRAIAIVLMFVGLQTMKRQNRT